MRFQRRWVPATLALATIAIVGCGGAETASKRSAATETTTEEATADQPTETADQAPAEGVLAECEAVQEALDGGSFNNGFGAILSSDSGTIEEDDSVFEASVAAATAEDGMDDALERYSQIWCTRQNQAAF
jgi:hypothetical protein